MPLQIQDQALCGLHKIIPGKQREIVCEVPKDRTTALVLFLIGVAFIATSLYLLLGGIGTIPTLSAGGALLIAGISFLVGANFLFFRQS